MTDGGTHLRALNAVAITRAVAEIGMRVDVLDTQFLLFQELANDSFLTRGIPIRDTIEQNLSDYSAIYWQGMGVIAPPPYDISHGMGIYALNNIAVSQAYELPQEPGYFFLGIKKYYAAMVTKIPIAGSDRKWVLMNVHMSAFDAGADARQAQIRAVFDFAQAEYSKGNFVVLGGDWNMRIADTQFPHTTAEKNLFWIYDFPQGLLPQGWRFGVDDSAPTVRTLHKPYVEGENYTAIVDGFAYSPNVRLRHIRTMDLKFRNSDHNPVTAESTTIY
ncbi:MAG: hypothetical protein AAED33_02360 [Paracoccaceae bacterium]